eukprot:TRINITY_DN67026_c1_g1_i1.p1 TRINITY_DN67026_c1_g1~~TRINITY_DN67026_c1_g1_i1.p1  ORF type:complete len:219 (+),score=28.48 TRINITY_DN67026_c1_g1_i1:473-1129(+)
MSEWGKLDSLLYEKRASLVKAKDRWTMISSVMRTVFQDVFPVFSKGYIFPKATANPQQELPSNTTVDTQSTTSTVVPPGTPSGSSTSSGRSSRTNNSMPADSMALDPDFSQINQVQSDLNNLSDTVSSFSNVISTTVDAAIAANDILVTSKIQNSLTEASRRVDVAEGRLSKTSAVERLLNAQKEVFQRSVENIEQRHSNEVQRLENVIHELSTGSSL